MAKDPHITRRAFLATGAAGAAAMAAGKLPAAGASSPATTGAAGTPATAPSSQEASDNGLELRSGSSTLRIESSTGRIAMLRHGDHTFVQEPVGEGLLRLHVPLTDFEAHMVSSHRTPPRCELRDDRITIDYADLLGTRGPTGISASITIAARGDAFELSCVVRNGSKAAIPQAFFPYIAGFRQVGGRDDQVVFAKNRFAPWRKWGAMNPDRRMTYMAYDARPELSMPTNDGHITGMKWLDFGGDAAGVSLYSLEKTATWQWMYVSAASRVLKAPDTIDLGWYFYPFIRPGETWQSPTFVLYPHAGDWRRGALKFKTHTDRTFVPPPTTPRRDATIGQYSLWMTWQYQDWQNVRYTFKDLPAVAAEARAAGLREMALVAATELNFCLPHKIRRPLGTADDLKAAVAAARDKGVNITPFVTCYLIREDTIGAARNPREWFTENVAGQRFGDNWTADPHMTPHMPILQIGSRAAYGACAGSKEWRKAFLQLVDQVADEWGCTGLIFDESFPCFTPCFNPLHEHGPAGGSQELNEVLAEAKRRLAARFGKDAIISGEGQWDSATEWMDMTWDWICFESDEPMAPFHMAFPRARACMKCTDDIPQINRIFTAGNWLDVLLEGGLGRLGDYPELTRHLASLAQFKARFSPFFNQRDVYLHTLGTRNLGSKPMWLRAHRSGGSALVMAASPDGQARQNAEVELNVPELLGADVKAALTVWTRKLEQSSSQTADGLVKLPLSIGPNDFVAIHVEPAKQ